MRIESLMGVRRKKKDKERWLACGGQDGMGEWGIKKWGKRKK